MTSSAINFWPTSAVDPGGYVIATPTSIFVPITTGTDRMAQREIEGLVRNERRNVARPGRES